MISLFGFPFQEARSRAIFFVRLTAFAAILYGAGLTPASATPPPGYYLVWGDEFNETSLDTNKWTYWVPGVFGNAVNVTNAVSLNGSNLVITTYTVGVTNYTAIVASQYHFHPRYGYYESSIQWGDTNGEWSAFWLRSPTMGTYLDDAFVSGGELDVCEHRYVGNTGNYIANIISANIHWDGYGSAEQSSGSPNVGTDLETGFHTYGLLWGVGTYQFQIDGSEVWDGSSVTPTFGSDIYVILSSQVNDTSTTWAGYIPPGGYGSQAQSTTMLLVDYFHYYAPTNEIFWTGAASAYLTNSANWVSNMPPLATSDLNFSYLSAVTNTFLGSDLSVDGLVVLEMANALTIGGTNTLTVGGGGIDMVAASKNVTINAAVAVGADQTWTVGRNNPGNVLTLNGNLGGTAALTKAGYGTLILNGTNSFSGVLNVDTGGSPTNDGAVRITSSAAVANAASPIMIRDSSTSTSTLQLSGALGSVTIPQSISFAGRNTNVAAIENLSGTNTLAGGITLTGGGLTYPLQSDAGALSLNGAISANSLIGSSTLKFQGAGSFFVSGPIRDANYSPVSLMVAGPGILTLAGTNAYSGATTVAGGTLAGNGAIAGAATIQSGGTISPGSANTVGTLAFGGSLTLAAGSTNFMHINKALRTNDQLQTAGALTYGGTLVVTNLGGTLTTGDSFQLFNAGSYSGNFSGLILPTLTGWGWNTNGLTNGVISVVPTAPQIISDLPLEITRVSGQSYTYSIDANATPPLGYQWYEGSTPLAGQTNSSYTLTAGNPGTYNYEVVITNAYGAVTSSVSTMSVFAWPTSAYAAAVRAYQPAGYWPLQETNAPAPATIETNLGTLGSVADAYYPSTPTNSIYITLGVPGALAGDPDRAAGFNQSGQTFAFVPRAAPALTLVPPFTLEVWFNPSNTTYGVILGEGGGASLNGGSTYGGFQFGWAGSSTTSFQLQLYKHGINSYSSVSTPTGYAPGTWYHYVATYDTASNATIYINGQPVASAVLAYVADNWSPMTIGNGKWNGLGAQRAVNGTIDEVAVYTNLLSPSDISAHYSAGISASPAVPYKQMVLNDHPLVYYRMDNPAYTTPGSGTSPVAFNYGTAPVDGIYLSGTVPAGVSGPAVLGWGTNPVASLLNGVFSCVDAGYDPTFNPTGTQPFTALLWFRGNPADSTMQALMGHGSNSWSLDLNGANGKLIWTSGAGSVTSSSIYNDGAWHEAAGVYDGTNNYLYVDGSLAGSSAATGTIAGETSHVYLGGDPDYTVIGVNERYFGGAIAQAAFFTNALTLAEIQATYQAAVTAPTPPTLSLLNWSGNQMELNWNYGTLQSATNVNGPYQDVTNLSSPGTISMTNAQEFFRLRGD